MLEVFNGRIIASASKVSIVQADEWGCDSQKDVDGVYHPHVDPIPQLKICILTRAQCSSMSSWDLCTHPKICNSRVTVGQRISECWGKRHSEPGFNLAFLFLSWFTFIKCHNIVGEVGSGSYHSIVCCLSRSRIPSACCCPYSTHSVTPLRKDLPG